jgi:hypothetical protein
MMLSDTCDICSHIDRHARACVRAYTVLAAASVTSVTGRCAPSSQRALQARADDFARTTQETATGGGFFSQRVSEALTASWSRADFFLPGDI